MDENNPKENKIINILNLFMNAKEEKHQFKPNYLVFLKKLIPTYAFDYSKLNIKIQKRLDLIFNKKNKFKFGFDLNNNRFFLLLIYNYIYENKKIPDFIDVFYKNNLLSFHTIFLFFEFFFSLVDDKEIEMDLYAEYIRTIISHIKKLIKLTKPNNIKEINNEIHDLFEKIFYLNNLSNVQNIKFTQKLIKHKKILSLLKLCFNYYNNQILNDTNKNYILHNLKQLCFKNLSIEHSNYLYSAAKKFLKSNFNNNKTQEDKNYYSYINGLLEFFIQLIDEEKQKNSNDKFFLFDSNQKDNVALKTSAIKLNNEYKFSNIHFSFIFSFQIIKSKENHINDNTKKIVIFSVNNFKTKKSIFNIFLNNNNLFLGLDFNDNENQKETSLMKNVKDNFNYLCYLYFEENKLYFKVNEISQTINHNLKLKSINKIYIIIGNIDTKYNDNEDKFQNFNGVIGPVLIYNSKIFNPLNVYEKINTSLKENYYLLGDMINNKFFDKNDVNFNFDYNKYCGISNNKSELINIINLIEKDINYPILYINPEIINNNIYFHKRNTFTDYQMYNYQNEINNNKNTFEINNINNNSDLIVIQKPFLDFFINNKMFDFLFLNIEFIYNEILLLDISDKKYNLL